jgi:hypothetical protein
MLGTQSRGNARSDSERPIKKQPRWWAILVAFGWILTGAILGFIYGKFGATAFVLTPKTEWDIPDILVVLFTFAAALYVQHVFVARSDIDKARRGALVELINQLRTAVDRLHADFRQRVDSQQVVVSDFGAVNSALAELRYGLEQCESHSSPSQIERALKTYRMTFSFPWDEMTLAEQALLEKTYLEVKKKISRLVLEIHSV